MKKEKDFNATIRINDGNNWSAAEKALLEQHAQQRQAQRTPERLKRNEMLAVFYRMENYLQEELTEETELLSVEFFTVEFCKVLDLNKKQFAGCLDTDVSNLNKYLKGQRAFSTDLALKFAHFFHTPADVWLKIPLKNELFLIAFEAKDANKYQKYDYEKVACEYR